MSERACQTARLERGAGGGAGQTEVGADAGARLRAVVGLLLIGSAVTTAFLFASAARLSSLTSTLLVAYLAFAANLGLTTIALSPFREVTRVGLGLAEATLIVCALCTWWARGRPGLLPLGGAHTTARELASDPATVLFFLFVGVLLVYELVLGLTVPPNNGDSLAYHLAKAAAWAQHGGVYWIPNAPTVRLNAFQPLAEQQILFLLVSTGTGTLAALPQFLSVLAIVVAVYGASRRLGFDARASACGALLLATFSLFALEATTAQNDLVAASFTAAAACLLLGPGPLEPALAGAAVGIGLGVKLTGALALPVLVWLTLIRGRRSLAATAGGALAGFVLLGMWGYVLNLVETGHVLGVGTGGLEDRASPSYPGSLANAFYLLYGLMDLSVLSNGLVYLLAIAGLVAAAGAAAWALRRTSLRQAAAEGAGVAVPFAAPLLVLGGAAVLALGARRFGFPIRGPGGILGPLESNLSQTYTRISNEDYSAFGPIGIVALVAASVLTFAAYVRRRADVRQLALACALPSFLLLIALSTSWNPFLIRFFAIPAVLAAPLVARLLHGRATTASYIAVAALTATLTITRDQSKPFSNPYGFGRPWNLTLEHSLDTNSRLDFATSITAFDRLVPPQACVGGVLGEQDPSYLLYGPHLRHRVVYLPATGAVLAALVNGLFYVVIDGDTHAPVADDFSNAGWRVRPIGQRWFLASEPGARAGSCGF